MSLLFLVATLALGQEPARPDAPTPPAPPMNPAPAAQGTNDWKDLVARDARVKFTARTPADAAAVLDLADAPSLRRAAAWIAIGCSSSVGDKNRVETATRTATGIERRAAILALGEMGAGGEDVLPKIVASGDKDVADFALLAILRTRRPGTRAKVEEIARDASHPLAANAAAFLVYEADPAASTPVRALRLLLALRWEAARAFGLVDGQAWPVLRTNELVADPDFLDEVVLRASAKLKKSPVADHVLPELLKGRGHGRLIAAVGAMPSELSQLVASGLWTPADPGEWATLVSEVGDQGVEALTIELLERATEIPETAWSARAALARVGRADFSRSMEIDLAKLSAADRVGACEALGATADPVWKPRLAPLREDPDARVRAAALVALALMGDAKAGAALDEALAGPAAQAGQAGQAGPTGQERAAAVEMLCRAAHSPAAALRIERRLAKDEDDDAVDLAIALCMEGRFSGRAKVREALLADPPPTGDRARRLLHALARRATSADVDVLRLLFPRPAERELNIEIAVGLIDLSDPAARPILHAAIWRGSFDRSLLACGLLARLGGIRALVEEILVPPAEATSTDLRRIGYAVGEWGGTESLETLARELGHRSGHPALQGALLGALGGRTR